MLGNISSHFPAIWTILAIFGLHFKNEGHLKAYTKDEKFLNILEKAIGLKKWPKAPKKRPKASQWGRKPPKNLPQELE